MQHMARPWLSALHHSLGPSTCGKIAIYPLVAPAKVEMPANRLACIVGGLLHVVVPPAGATLDGGVVASLELAVAMHERGHV